MNDFSARVKDYQDRQADFDRSGSSGPAADRTRRNLEKEAAALKREDAELKAERSQVETAGVSNDAVTKLNVRVAAQQERAQSWNDRSKKLVDDQQAYEDERISWIDNCGNRRYKEDDEKAIKAGK
jgi:hypothetical protein